MTRKDALEYLNYVIHEGGMDEGEIEGKTDKELSDMASGLMDRADAAYDEWKERYAE